jgi:putative salt-induced outer membrane protein YdiY
MRKKIVVGICFLLAGYFSNAQVVNIEKKRGADTLKFQGDVFLAIDYDKNASELFELKNDIQLQYQEKKSTYLFFNHIKYVRAGGNPYLNEGFQHLRYKYDFKPKLLEGELFTQYQFNTINKLEHRFLLGGGPRFCLSDSNSRMSFHIGPLLMYEYEKLSNENNPTQVMRLSTYFSFDYQVSKALLFRHTTYYQPALLQFNDYRISTESSLWFYITDKLSFRLVFEFLYDTAPPQSVPELIYSVSNGLNYSF